VTRSAGKLPRIEDAVLTPPRPPQVHSFSDSLHDGFKRVCPADPLFSSSSIPNCYGLDKLWKWNVVYIGMFVMNNGALKAVKKLYICLCICLCAARDTNQDCSPKVVILYTT
jgi:hypothetical protein